MNSSTYWGVKLIHSFFTRFSWNHAHKKEKKRKRNLSTKPSNMMCFYNYFRRCHVVFNLQLQWKIFKKYKKVIITSYFLNKNKMLTKFSTYIIMQSWWGLKPRIEWNMKGLKRKTPKRHQWRFVASRVRYQN